MPKIWYDQPFRLRLSNSTAGDHVWYRWNTTATPIYSLERDPWPVWVQTSTTSATYDIRESTWIAWNGERLGSISTAARIMRERDERETQRELERAQARRTARQLLTAHLSDDQLETFESAGCFDVISQHGRRYRIYCNRGVMHNVFLIDAEGNHLFEMCAYTPGVPAEDTFMAQKLYLEHQEDEFLRMANIWDRRPGMSRTVSHEGRRWTPPAGVGAVMPPTPNLHLVAA